MAMLPILLDMVDEIYESLDKDPKSFADIPMLFVPQRGHHEKNCHKTQGCPRIMRRGCLHRCPRMNKHHPHHHNNMECPCKPESGDAFQVMLDVKSFKPDEISVKVKGREIIVEASHEEREDEFGLVARQFTRRYVVPEEFDLDTVATYLDNEGKMTIKAEKPKAALDERVVPIERIEAAAEKPAVGEKPAEEEPQKKSDEAKLD